MGTERSVYGRRPTLLIVELIWTTAQCQVSQSNRVGLTFSFNYLIVDINENTRLIYQGFNRYTSVDKNH